MALNKDLFIRHSPFRRKLPSYTSYRPLYSSNKEIDQQLNKNEIIYSGIQPTGLPHIGNYFGAIANWKRIQDQSMDVDTTTKLFSIVDMHSLTTTLDRKILQKTTFELTATLLACGIDPSKSILYNQSRVAGHAELAWILLCLTPMSDLKSMTQYKEKMVSRQVALTGLYCYPVLMAADILLYRTTRIPVGDDQTQHVELTKTLANKFNRTFGHYVDYQDQPIGSSSSQSFFPIPTIEYTQNRRIMNLRDANKKMSKSDASESSRIHLADSIDQMVQKLQIAKTDNIHGIQYDPIQRPEVANLLNIYTACSKESINVIVERHQHHDMLAFKKALIHVVLEELVPISKKIAQYKNEPAYIDQILKEGANKANNMASKTMDQIRTMVGYL